MAGEMRWSHEKKWKPTEQSTEKRRLLKGLRKFARWYIEAALWSTVDDEGHPLDQNYAFSDISNETLERMAEDANEFEDTYDLWIGDNPKKGAYDFWLTRNGHGNVGFLDGGWPEHGDDLTEGSKTYGSFDLYIGDDGEVHGQ